MVVGCYGWLVFGSGWLRALVNLIDEAVFSKILQTVHISSFIKHILQKEWFTLSRIFCDSIDCEEY